jgi:glyoxylase-like metal-dependent hydrolase (beta-lactamase superfamily II)
LTREGVLVDAPAETEKILRRLNRVNPISIKYLLLTHNHVDHIGALSQLKCKLKVPVVVHSLDTMNLPSLPDILLEDDDNLFFGKMRLKVLHTPGHTPGSVCYLINRHLFSGDTIFPGGPGKTRTPSDFKQIIKSITEKIFVLPEETQIYPGHGETTTLRDEKKKFAVFSSQPHNPNLCGDVLWLSS